MHRIAALDTDSTVAGGSGPAVSVLVVNYHAYDELEACLDVAAAASAFASKSSWSIRTRARDERRILEQQAP